MAISFGVNLIRNDKLYIYANSAFAFAWGVNFILIDAYAAATMDFLILARTISAIWFEKSSKLCFCFICVFIVGGFISYIDVKDIFPVMATILATYLFFFTSGHQLRSGIGFSNMLWVIHNVLAGSISGTVHKVIQMFLSFWVGYSMRKKELSEKAGVANSL